MNRFFQTNILTRKFKVSGCQEQVDVVSSLNLSLTSPTHIHLLCLGFNPGPWPYSTGALLLSCASALISKMLQLLVLWKDFSYSVFHGFLLLWQASSLGLYFTKRKIKLKEIKLYLHMYYYLYTLHLNVVLPFPLREYASASLLLLSHLANSTLFSWDFINCSLMKSCS